MTQIRVEQQARQQLSLTPKQQQSVKLLQMSTLEFSQEISAAMANNPFLEEPEESVDAPPAQQTLPEKTLSSYPGDYPGRGNNDQAHSDVGEWARGGASMQDALLADLCSYPLNERDRALAEHIIEALDDDGYLRAPFSELAGTEAFAHAPSNDEWEIALHLVQQLGTPGLGARDLKECMILQLNALPSTTDCGKLALGIILDHLDTLARGDYAGLARSLHCSKDDIQAACSLIRSLDPHPGRSYSPVDPSTFIIPDVTVRKVGMHWTAASNKDAIPQARLNATYARLFRGTRYNERSLMAQELQEARWLLRSLEQRSNTIERVAQAIVARQQTFFDYGEIALRPLMLSEVADELGMHESTVSRATSHKYLASPRGIFEFKHFFSRELPTRSGGTCSAGAVRALIQEMIDDEDPKSPLSDVILTHKLEHEGIVVARRTVSKYRAQIKIPPAELRRTL